ncbi:DnaA N-terminal domain-containing protein [Paenibacillus alvei]|uniref:DnaA N-terminal domain-containing protein n=1 Tax=Paenibacillus alvei TaxID=44250 RepID=UPI0013D955BE|nr:DnaA N-terminal domain-containing protein [Paenibacillus alvei]NEZ42881.1 hypothetical protein [Paenibacillus alvei]
MNLLERHLILLMKQMSTEEQQDLCIQAGLMIYMKEALKREKFKINISEDSKSKFEREVNKAEMLWMYALEEIKLNISPTEFEAWFLTTKGKFEGDETIVILCRTSPQKEWISRRYDSLIKLTVSTIIGDKVNIKYELIQ